MAEEVPPEPAAADDMDSFRVETIGFEVGALVQPQGGALAQPQIGDTTTSTHGPSILPDQGPPELLEYKETPKVHGLQLTCVAPGCVLAKTPNHTGCAITGFPERTRPESRYIRAKVKIHFLFLTFLRKGIFGLIRFNIALSFKASSKNRRSMLIFDQK